MQVARSENFAVLICCHPQMLLLPGSPNLDLAS